MKSDRTATPANGLIRLSGELAIKSRRTRARFQRQLVRNLRDAFRSEGVGADVDPGWSRMFVHADTDAWLDPASRVFGISSSSRVVGECPAELDAIVETGARLFGEAVKGKTYGVRARRSGDHPFSSSDIHERLGAALNPGATVDLDDPQVPVRVEVRAERALFYDTPSAGADGLPLGVQGRAVVLLSGGFDSAVAAWMTLRRGVELDYVFCNLGGAAYRRMVIEVGRVLADRWSYGTRPRLFALEFGPVVDAMRERARPAYLQVVLKRFMYRAASEIGIARGADAIVTGESIGQVSSQTLRNLRAIEGASALPVLRPLVGFHKEEILDRARRIGTYDLSARVREYCSVAPGRPVTAASAEDAAAQEAAVGEAELETALAAMAEIDLRALDDSEAIAENLYVSDIPADARVLDARPAPALEAAPWPGAEPRDPDELEFEFGDLPRDSVYILVCAEGLRTAHIAERMQAEGYEAYSLLGGDATVRRLLKGRRTSSGEHSSL